MYTKKREISDYHKKCLCSFIHRNLEFFSVKKGQLSSGITRGIVYLLVIADRDSGS